MKYCFYEQLALLGFSVWAIPKLDTEQLHEPLLKGAVANYLLPVQVANQMLRQYKLNLTQEKQNRLNNNKAILQDRSNQNESDLQTQVL
jgi:hypothetical protein